MPLGIIDVGSFEVLSDHGDTTEDDIVVDASSEEFTGTMPPLETRTSRDAEMRCGKFVNHCNGSDS